MCDAKFFTIAKMLVADRLTEPLESCRNFSSALKEELYNIQSGLGELCRRSTGEQRLDEENYVNIDHIIPSSKGGRANSNAQLVHNMQLAYGSTHKASVELDF